MIVSIGIDLGGTKVSAVLADQQGTVRHRAVWPDHAAHDYGSSLAAVDTAVSACLSVAERDDLEVCGIGVAIAAWLGAGREYVLEAANLGFSNRPLRADLQSRYRLPVRLVNDADAAAIAEARFGAGVGQSVLVTLTLGTGVGGGIVVADSLMTGARGLAGELGHVNVTDDDLPCVCGASGCLEVVASGRAVARRGGELVAAGAAPILRDIAGGVPQAVTSANVVTAASAGDDAARAVLTDVGRSVGVALARITPVLDPSLAVLGGGLAAGAGTALTSAAHDALVDRLSLHHLRAAMPIRLASAGPDAGALGAATIVHDEQSANCHQCSDEHHHTYVG